MTVEGRDGVGEAGDAKTAGKLDSEGLSCSVPRQIGHIDDGKWPLGRVQSFSIK